PAPPPPPAAGIQTPPPGAAPVQAPAPPNAPSPPAAAPAPSPAAGVAPGPPAAPTPSPAAGITPATTPGPSPAAGIAPAPAADPPPAAGPAPSAPSAPGVPPVGPAPGANPPAAGAAASPPGTHPAPGVKAASRQAAAPAPNAPAKPALHPPGAATAAPAAPVAPTGTAAAPSGATGPEKPGREIQLKGDRLTVRVTGVPLDDLLNAIADQSDAEIRGSVLAPRDVTTDFENVPVQDGLHRILGDQNFLLTYRQDGTLRTLALLGGPEEAPPSTRVVKAGATLAELMQRSVPVIPGTKVARFLGHDSATLQQLGDVMRGQDDVRLRMEAMRAGVNGIDSQQDLRDATVKALQGADDAVIQSVARGLAGDRARETVSQIATLSRTPEIRTRMLEVLKSMDQPPSTPCRPDYCFCCCSSRRYLATAELCLARSTLNSCEPSPRATK